MVMDLKFISITNRDSNCISAVVSSKKSSRLIVLDACPYVKRVCMYVGIRVIYRALHKLRISGSEQCPVDSRSTLNVIYHLGALFTSTRVARPASPHHLSSLTCHGSDQRFVSVTLLLGALFGSNAYDLL